MSGYDSDDEMSFTVETKGYLYEPEPAQRHSWRQREGTLLWKLEQFFTARLAGHFIYVWLFNALLPDGWARQQVSKCLSGLFAGGLDSAESVVHSWENKMLKCLSDVKRWKCSLYSVHLNWYLSFYIFTFF